jgi:RNA polymerase subunit RPABC4/transcription elongation factor Spt4
MRICRFCEKVIRDQDEICGNCGYNPQSDTMSAAFVKKNPETAAAKKQNILAPGVKNFVFWGMIIIVFSLGVKYQGKINGMVKKAKNIFSGNKISKSAQASEKANQNKAVKLIGVRSHKEPAGKSSGKNIKIEGIFYDPQGRSYAMINGQLVWEQKSFENMVIKKINRGSVEVVQDGQDKVITVSK